MSRFRPTPDERDGPLPGDELVGEPLAAWTRAVTIRAPRERVWPWIVQIGADRAGWYSYDWIDNAGRPSARTILPAHQRLEAGDIIPALPGERDGFHVADVAAPERLVLSVPEPVAAIVSWAFVVRAPEPASSRLLVRARVSSRWRDVAFDAGSGGRLRLINHVYRLLARLPTGLMVAAGGFGHGVMERKMLDGIRRRAEA